MLCTRKKSLVRRIWEHSDTMDPREAEGSGKNPVRVVIRVREEASDAFSVVRHHRQPRAVCH